MKIRMLETAKGSEDGFTARDYAAGETYEVSEALAKTFIDSGLAAKAGGRKAKGEEPEAAATEQAADAPAAEPAADAPAAPGEDDAA